MEAILSWNPTLLTDYTFQVFLKHLENNKSTIVDSVS